jgi:hypothetical protein
MQNFTSFLFDIGKSALREQFNIGRFGVNFIQIIFYIKLYYSNGFHGRF